MQQGLDRRRAARPPGAATTPLVRDRRDAPPKPTTWDDALNRVAQAISRSHQRHGRDSVGCFGGGGLTNEKAYQLGKFARVALGTFQIDDNGRFCMSSAAAASPAPSASTGGLPFPLADIAAADVILLVGANPADTMPPAMQWLDEGRSRGATHITIDPRRSPPARAAWRTTRHHLRPHCRRAGCVLTVPGRATSRHAVAVRRPLRHS